MSRPTLYRWFPTRALLLGAVTAHETERFDRGLDQLAQSHEDPARRLDAALRYIVTYIDDYAGTEAVHASDPAFALQSISDSHRAHVDSVARALHDALDQVPAVASGELTRTDASELLLRIAYSHYLVPSTDRERLLATVRAVLGVPAPARRGRPRQRP